MKSKIFYRYTTIDTYELFHMYKNGRVELPLGAYSGYSKNEYQKVFIEKIKMGQPISPIVIFDDGYMMNYRILDGEKRLKFLFNYIESNSAELNYFSYKKVFDYQIPVVIIESVKSELNKNDVLVDIISNFDHSSTYRNQLRVFHDSIRQLAGFIYSRYSFEELSKRNFRLHKKISEIISIFILHIQFPEDIQEYKDNPLKLIVSQLDEKHDSKFSGTHLEYILQKLDLDRIFRYLEQCYNSKSEIDIILEFPLVVVCVLTYYRLYKDLPEIDPFDFIREYENEKNKVNSEISRSNYVKQEKLINYFIEKNWREKNRKRQA